LHLSGFSNAAIRVFDITDALNIFELSPKVVSHGGSYEATVGLAVSGPAVRTILVFASDAVSAPVSVSRHFPKFLEDRWVGADIVIVTHPDFAESLTPLAPHRNRTAIKSPWSPRSNYDEYNTGERSPFAIRSFLMDAARRWQRKPQALLLVGDASFDPRNYLGLGNFDFVPRMIETAAFKTASDDCFSDFQQTGYATLATGRLPVRTAADANLLVARIINYERGIFAGAWNGQVLLVGDQNVDSNFSSAVGAAATNVPPSMQVSKILTDGLDATAARAQVITALNNGALLVDYQGHGAEQQWSFVDLFDSTDAAALTNGGRMPVYLFYSGDYMSTEDGGSPLIRIGALSLELHSASAAHVFCTPCGAVAVRNHGTALYTTAGGHENLVIIVASDVRVTPVLAVADIGRVTINDRCNVTVVGQRGEADVRVGSESHSVEEGKAYRVRAENEISSHQWVSPDVENYHEYHNHKPSRRLR
jgi:hypothetical protein